MRLIDADALGLTDMEIIMCNGDYKEALKMLIDKIDNSPTIEPKQKMGKWDPIDLTWGRSFYACTACRHTIEMPTECGKPMYKFCPYCGAEMEIDNE